jgi:hypothetical protein
MPGANACVRCGTSMRLRAEAIDVHPPRARPLVLHLRRWIPWRRLYYPVRDVVFKRGGALEHGAATIFDTAPLKPGTLPRMLVPGWAQRFQGQTQRGRAFFGVWSALLTTGLLSFGSTFGSIMLGLAFAVHAGSALDLLLPVRDRTPQQILIRGLIVGLVLLAIYIPPGRVLLHFVDARQWLRSEEPFAAGDVVLFNPRAYVSDEPQVGDVVLFQDSNWFAQAPEYRHTIIRGGEGIDRVLAGPGSTVSWKEGELWVDGRQSTLRPLNGQALPNQADLRVPAGMYYIVPSTSTIAGVALRSTQPDRVLRPRETILGRAIVRHYPLWRWWWMH